MTRYQILNALLHFIMFFMGAGIGSFLNVVIYRLPRGLSVNQPRRSFCPTCKKQIPMYENVPLLSWLLLRGRCSSCKSPISVRYFGVELLTALMFYAVFWKFHGDWAGIQDWGPQVLCLWILVSLLIAGTFIDIEHFILPHEITIGGAVVGLISATVVPSLVGQYTHLNGLWVSFASGALGCGGLWLVVELGKLAFGRLSFRQKPKFLAKASKNMSALAARIMSSQWLEGHVGWSVSQPNEEEPPILQFGGDKLGWADIFTRPKDRLVITCGELVLHVKTQPEADDSEVVVRRFENVKAEIHMETLKVTGGTAAAGSEELRLEAVKQIKGTASELVIPREAMGFGDVLFLMMIGTFLGWQAVLFTIFAASILGTLIAGFWKLIGRSEWTSKIPFGPYIAAGAVIWLFCGPNLLQWYMGMITRRPEF